MALAAALATYLALACIALAAALATYLALACMALAVALATYLALACMALAAALATYLALACMALAAALATYRNPSRSDSFLKSERIQSVFQALASVHPSSADELPETAVKAWK